MDSGYVGIAGVGVCLPVAGDLTELATHLAKNGELDGLMHLPGVPHTDLQAVEVRAGVCPEPDPAVAPRKLPRECRLALTAASAALADEAPASDGIGVGTVWVSSTAGTDEYAQICVEAATLPPGLVSPMAGPQAAYNGPASAVSIRLGLTGPQFTLTGGCEAGADSFVEASRMLHEGQCAAVVVGGSATVSRWRLTGTDDGRVLAEGAVCLLLSRATGRAPGISGRPLRRSRLSVSDVELASFASECMAQMSAAPDAIVISASPAWQAAAVRVLGYGGAPCWFVEESSGDLGAASGLVGVVAAVAVCGSAEADPSSALVLALGRTGNAVAIEVLLRET